VATRTLIGSRMAKRSCTLATLAASVLALAAVSGPAAAAASASPAALGAVTHTRHRAPGAMALPHARDPHSGSRAVSHPTSAPRAPRPGELGARFGFGSALVGSAPTGNGPSQLAANPATHTIYVANGNNANGPDAYGDTVSVIDARHCNAHDVSQCKGPWPTITVGNRKPTDLPSGIAIDQKTDTVYVTNVGDNTVSVFNGATCNATVTSGCGQTPAEVPVGLQPITLAADPANHTVYVANYGAPGLGGPPGNSTTVSMINSAICNATDLAGCPATPPPTVNVKAAPNDVTVDQATHTVYVTTIGTHKAQNGWAVFNARTCNATVQTGCATIGRLIGDPAGPNGAALDAANDTLYTANWDNTISAFGLRHCDAAGLAGCATDKPGIVTPVPPGIEHDLYVAVDTRLHSVYVTYQRDDALMVVNTRVCNGRHLAGCATLHPPTIHTGTDPEGIVLDPQTQTLYTADEVDNTVSVFDASRCNAAVTTGCRQPPPAITLSRPGNLAAAPAVATLYVPTGTNTVAMINTKACNARRHHGCTLAPPTVTVGTYAAGIAVDQRTHTVYVASFGSGKTGSVSVLDERTCNATTTTGCASAHTLQVPGGNPQAIAVNPATDTLYVATDPPSGPTGPGKPSTISVFNGATCNATNTSGCGQAPHSVTVGFSALALAVNVVTDTIYVANFAEKNAPYAGNTVSVIDGATCNATTTSGCGNAPKTITVGPAFTTPISVAVDPATDTVYVADLQNGEGLGTVSVINGATCNGNNHTGCGQTPPKVAAGFGATAVAIDLTTNAVYVTNIEDTSVSVINGNTCNGNNHTGCGQTPPKVAVGNYPGAIALEAAACTAYVSNNDNTVSVIPLTHPKR
jgi:DNA-binding beta-propeller fold protein YncE